MLPYHLYGCRKKSDIRTSIVNTIEDLISNYAHGDKEGLNMPLEDLLDSNKWKQAFRANVQIKRRCV